MVIDGQETVGPAVKDHWTAHFRKGTDGKWAGASVGEAASFPGGPRASSGEAGSFPCSAHKTHGLTADDIANANLVLWGDPSSNSALKAILEKAALAKTVPQFPLSWAADSVMLGPVKYPAATHAPILIFPNPLNPKRYLVLNSGFTFREGSTTTNAQQTPKLPDWAIIDLRTPPSAKWPGLVVDAGFFDESWQWPKK